MKKIVSQNKYAYIIWDWNGTLLNDVEHSISVTNQMLIDRGLKPFNQIEDYQEVFCFPIFDYYEKIGFKLENETFEELSEVFIKNFHSSETNHCKLHESVKDVLEDIHRRGIKQLILSASEVNNLNFDVNRFDIGGYFETLLGLSDIYAKSKIEVGRAYLKETGIKHALLVGDTTHDYEVAQALNVDCVLISNGHQSRKVLETCGVPVLNSITEVLNYL